MSLKLDILIIGAGLSGLSAAIQCAISGHAVTVSEAAKELAEVSHIANLLFSFQVLDSSVFQVGAGLQLTPNSTRLLQQWNVFDTIRHQVCEPTTMTIINYRGKVLAHEENFAANIRRKYGAPFVDCHRVDLQQALAKQAKELGVTLVLNARVTNIDLGSTSGDRARVRTSEGQKFEADLIVGADGLWSSCRSTMLGRNDPPLPTGDLAYRIVLRLDQIGEQNLRDMVQNPGCRYWLGPDGHVAAFSMRGGNMYNVVLVTPDDLEDGVARAEAKLDEMRRLFEGWDPV